MLMVYLVLLSRFYTIRGFFFFFLFITSTSLFSQTWTVLHVMHQPLEWYGAWLCAIFSATLVYLLSSDLINKKIFCLTFFLAFNFDRQIWPHIEKLDANVLGENVHPLFRKAVYCGLRCAQAWCGLLCREANGNESVRYLRVLLRPNI